MIKINEKGSITLFTLIAMMFFLTIAFTAYASAMAKLQAQNEDLERIKASYEQDLTEEGLRELYNKLTGTRDWLPGDGTEQNPYKIYTIEDLVELSNRTNTGNNYLGKYIELMNDLDFNNVKSYEKADRTDFGDVNNNGTIEELRIELTTGDGWQAIGKTENSQFMGELCGNEYEIKGLYINTTTEFYGFFGFNNGKIKDITIDGCINSQNRYIGGIVAQNNNNGEIVNCNSKIVITATNFIGGISGKNLGKIEKCKNYKKIEGTLVNNGDGKVGGIVGDNGGYIIKSYNEGDVSSMSSDVGGITGVNRMSIDSCINNANITGNSRCYRWDCRVANKK